MPNVFNVNGVEPGTEHLEEYTAENVNQGANPIDEPQENPPFHLQRTQKIALVLISVIGIGVLALGILQAQNILKIPVGSTAKDRAQAAATASLTPAQPTEDAAILKTKDTDADGINDFDELHVYDTSPYLADSDSDSLSDADEIKNGTDPTCPQGQQCFRSSIANTGDANLANITPAQLRQLIVKSGQLTQEQADQIDDQTLLDTYKEALAKNPDAQTSQITGQNSRTIQDAQTPQTVNDLKNLTPAQIKQLLIDQGMDEADLAGVDDATLKSLYIEALDKAQQTP